MRGRRQGNTTAPPAPGSCCTLLGTAPPGGVWKHPALGSHCSWCCAHRARLCSLHCLSQGSPVPVAPRKAVGFVLILFWKIKPVLGPSVWSGFALQLHHSVPAFMHRPALSPPFCPVSSRGQSKATNPGLLAALHCSCPDCKRRLCSPLPSLCSGWQQARSQLCCALGGLCDVGQKGWGVNIFL